MKKPCRIDVFGPVTITRKRGKPKIVGAAWQAHNPDPWMERMMARLSGSGSFYWASPRDAYRAATVLLRDPAIEACRVETISGVEVAYLRREVTTGDDRATLAA